MLEQHFASSDPDRGHEMYHDDAVLEFPQSGERFVGVENLREWRSNYPASTAVEFREVRGRDDLWIAEISISYDQGPWSFGETRSRASRSTSRRASIRPTGVRSGEPRRERLSYGNFRDGSPQPIQSRLG